MDALVHQRAAILGPGAAPRRLLIIGHAAVPQHAHRAADQPAEAPVVQRAAQLPHRRVEAVLVADAEGHAPRLRLADHALRVGGAQGHGLFDQRVLARADAVQRDAGVVAALGRHGAAVGVDLLQHLMVVGVDFRLFARRGQTIGRLFLRAFGHRVADGGQLHDIPVRRRRRDVVFGNPAAANQCKTVLLHFFVSCFLKFCPAPKNPPLSDRRGNGAFRAARCSSGPSRPSWRCGCRTPPAKASGFCRSQSWSAPCR